MGLIYLCLVTLLTLLSFHQALFFSFWRDDWSFLLTAQQNPLALMGSTVHPATWLEDIIFIRLFGWNPISWNILGFLLRILAATSVGLMIWSFTRQKKAAVLSALFFACSYVGLETVGWLNSHVVPFTIIFISLGFYFWFKHKRQNYLPDILFSILFFYLSFIGDPGRTFPIVVLIFIWEIFILWLKKDFKQFTRGVFSILIISSLFLLTYPFFIAHFGVGANQVLNLQSFVPGIEAYKYFFTSIGNLLLSGFIKIDEFGGTSNYDFNTALAGGIILLLTILGSLFIGLVKKSEKFLAITWFALWIPIFYFPNWLFNPTYVSSGTHRYLGVAGVGFIAIISLLISYFKSYKVMIFLSVIWIVLNIFICNRILKQESLHRSIKTVDRIWDKVIADVPKYQKSYIFLFNGDYQLKTSVIEWSGGPWPYLVKTNLKNNSPVIALSYQSALNFLCSKSVYSLSDVYAWRMEKDVIINTSSEDREFIKTLAREQNCHLK